MISTLLLSSCKSVGLNLYEVKVSIVYGSEKQVWLMPLVEQYNSEKHKTEDGATIVIEATPMGSIESVNAIIDGTLQPTVWSPASSLYLPVANAEWRNNHNSDLVEGTPNDLVLSPVVIAMWEPMAKALGWPGKALGWSDIAALATSDEGWAAYGYPEWGDFKFGHTHPSYSNSGLVSIITQSYAGANKQRDLTLDDLQDPAVQQFVAEVQSSIIHYGTSTGFFANRMFENGPSYLSAAVLYENLVVAQEDQRIRGISTQLPVVAIYPKEGTFWSNHPYAVLNAPWVTPEQKAAAQDFERYLLDKPQQMQALEFGFRPADPRIRLSAPLDEAHGVDISQPQTILEVPQVEVITGIQTMWEQVKKPVDLVVVMDISGSMEGDKIASARSSLLQFLELLDDRDRVEVILFNSELTLLSELSELGPKREELSMRISGVTERGGTRLYDCIQLGYEDLLANGDEDHIRSMIVLSDGQDNESVTSLTQVLAELDQDREQGGNAIKLFTIAFGDDANSEMLKQLAEITGGKQYDSDPSNLNKIYDDIATFF
jgi:Ca-activated chloride channel family protein